MELIAYLEELQPSDDPLLTEIGEQMAANKTPPINITPPVGRLLQLLIKLHRPSRLLEVGTLFGISGIWMGRAMSEGAKLTTIERGQVSADFARDNFGRAALDDKIDVVVGDAKEVLSTLSGPFDFVFFDANKSEYPTYLDLVIPLLAPGGLLVADNVLCKNKPIDPHPGDKTAVGLATFNKRLADDPRFELVLLPILHDGVAIARYLG